MVRYPVVSKLFFSLCLSALVCFTIPILLVSSSCGSLWLLSSVPLLTAIAQNTLIQLVGFLSTFGDGSPLGGIILIGVICALVGGGFDLFNFYFYQSPQK